MARKTQISKDIILRKALEMLIRDGYSSINIKTLSAEIGCSTQPLVWHFGNMEGLRTALAEYALLYANHKIAPSAEDAAEALSQVVAAYIRIALREPNLFKFVYMNSESSASLSKNDELKSDNSFGELVKRLSASYSISEEKIGRYLQQIIIYTHGIAALVVAGIVKASEEEVMQMVSYAGNAFCIQEGIPLEQAPYAQRMQAESRSEGGNGG